MLSGVGTLPFADPAHPCVTWGGSTALASPCWTHLQGHQIQVLFPAIHGHTIPIVSDSFIPMSLDYFDPSVFY